MFSPVNEREEKSGERKAKSRKTIRLRDSGAFALGLWLTLLVLLITPLILMFVIMYLAGTR